MLRFFVNFCIIMRIPYVHDDTQSMLMIEGEQCATPLLIVLKATPHDSSFKYPLFADRVWVCVKVRARCSTRTGTSPKNRECSASSLISLLFYCSYPIQTLRHVETLVAESKAKLKASSTAEDKAMWENRLAENERRLHHARWAVKEGIDLSVSTVRVQRQQGRHRNASRV